jgi:hypothetical protein
MSKSKQSKSKEALLETDKVNSFSKNSKNINECHLSRTNAKQLDILTENISNYFNDIHKNIDNIYLKIDMIDSKIKNLENDVYKINIYYENIKSQNMENERQRQYIYDSHSNINATINTLMTNLNKHILDHITSSSIIISPKNKLTDVNETNEKLQDNEKSISQEITQSDNIISEKKKNRRISIV